MIEIIRVERGGEKETVCLTAQEGTEQFELTLGQYKGLTASKKQVAVTADDIDRELMTLVQKSASFVSVNRAIQNGDTAVIDFKGYLDGIPFEGGAGENYRLGIGSGTFVPGFEEQIVGMKEGEERDIDIMFPKNYTPELAGKAVVFHVKVRNVLEPRVPELDDAFAKSAGAETMAELRQSIADKILAGRMEDVQLDFENAIMRELIHNMQFTLPEGIIEERLKNVIGSFTDNLASQGISLEEYFELSGSSMEDVRAAARPAAIGQAEAELALTAVVSVEDLKVTDEDIQEEMDRMKQVYSVFGDDLLGTIDPEILRKDIAMRKAYHLIMSEAKEQ